MTFRKSVPIVGAGMVVLFAIFIAWDISSSDEADVAGCYAELTQGTDHIQHAMQFCECMGHTPLTREGELGGDELFCRVGFRDYPVQEYFCEMNPEDMVHFNCPVIGQQKLSSFAPRHDTHIISGLIYKGGKPISAGAIVTYYHPDKIKDKIIDNILINGRYQIDLSLMPGGWRVGDVGMLEIHYQGQIIKKTLFVKSSSEQVENVLLS